MSSSKRHIEKAIKNIEDDREITRELLDDAIKWLSVDDGRHRDIGMTLAKYVETLQRSNEQLVKLCALMSKNESSDELTDKDFAQIFDQIQKSEEDPSADPE
ncbi:MAG: hypothetical protein ACW99F_00520 [Candidatus Hodarchaeales archaeon]|jgi:hypothetical protein